MKTTFFQVILLMFFGLIMFDANAQMYKEETAFPFRISLAYNAVNDQPTIVGTIVTSEPWSIQSYPSRIGFEAFVSRDFSLEGAFSYNEFLPRGEINGSVIHKKVLIHSYDLNLKYSLRNALGGGNLYKTTFINHFDPYLSLGMSYTDYAGYENKKGKNVDDKYTGLYGVLGGGITYWFSQDDESYYNGVTDRIGVFGQAQAKANAENNFIQLSLGLIYKFK